MSMFLYTLLVAVSTLVLTSGLFLWVIWFVSADERGEAPGALGALLSLVLFLVWPASLVGILVWLAILNFRELLRGTED